MDLGEVEITTELVIAVIGALGLIIELLVLAGPIFGRPERRRGPRDRV